MLDFLKQSGLVRLRSGVEGEYWEKRDLVALAKEVGDWNELVAGVVSDSGRRPRKGHLDPITGFPSFEHLEAEGARTDWPTCGGG